MSTAAGVICYFACTVMGGTLFVFCRYLFRDDLRSRKGLIMSCAIIIVAHFIGLIGIIVGCTTYVQPEPAPDLNKSIAHSKFSLEQEPKESN